MRSLRARIAAAALVSILSALGACTLERPPSFVPTDYDFGPPRPQASGQPRIKSALLIPSVTAPPWLDDNGITYRLLYSDPARPHVYARSRWTAEPAMLLTDRLRNRLSGVTEGVITPAYSMRADYALRVELQDFSQVFPTPNESRVVLKARATLMSSDDRKLLAQKDFAFERPAAPNASGAIEGLTQAVDEFIDAIVTWTAATLPPRMAVAKDAAQPAGK